MNCPGCGQTVASGTAACGACGKELPSAVGGDAFAASALAPSRWKEILAAVGVLISWVLIAFLAAASTIRDYGELSAESSGYFAGRIIGAFLFPLLGTWIYYRVRRLKPTLAYRTAVISSWAVFVALIALVGEAGRARPLNQGQMYKHVGDLVKQASGEMPVAPDAEWYDGPTRAFYGDIFALNRQYAKELDVDHRMWLKRAYSAESYATRENIEAAEREFHEILAVDEKYESVDPLFEKFEARVRAAKARRREKEDLIKGVRDGSSKGSAARQETFRAEKAWLKATIALYEYMSGHLADYSVKSNKLVFRTEGLREEFRVKQASAIALRDAALKAKGELDTTRKESLTKMGISDDPTKKVSQ